MKLEVLSHEPHGVRRIVVELQAPATVADALTAAGLALLPAGGLGMFGRPCAIDDALEDGGRLEIYRPLVADPKQIRRQRARLRRPAS